MWNQEEWMFTVIHKTFLGINLYEIVFIYFVKEIHAKIKEFALIYRALTNVHAQIQAIQE